MRNPESTSKNYSHVSHVSTAIKFFVCLFTVLVTVAINYFVLPHIWATYNTIMVVIVSIFVYVLILLVTTLWQTFPYANSDQNKFSVDIREVHRTYVLSQIWKISYVIWLAVNFFLVGMSIFSSVIAAFIAGDGDPSSNYIIFYSIISICFTAVNFLVRPKEQASGYRYAFEKLTQVLQSYMGGDAGCKWEDVVAAIAKCEKKITRRTFDC